jgi:hypothetical protein
MLQVQSQQLITCCGGLKYQKLFLGYVLSKCLSDEQAKKTSGILICRKVIFTVPYKVNKLIQNMS